MSKITRETVTLTALFLASAGLIGMGFWWASDWAGLESAGRLCIALLDGDVRSAQAGRQTWPGSTQAFVQRAQTLGEVTSVPSGLFNYGGSTTWAPIRDVVDPIIQNSQAQFQLRYTKPINAEAGSGTGIRMLLEGQLSFSQSSRPLKEEEYQKAQQRGFTLKQIPIAIDGIAIAVHPDLNIPGLTLMQLKEIYTGNIDNWELVGGPNLPITPYSRSAEAGGTVEFFIENVMENEEFGDNVEIISDTTAGLKNVGSDLGGIYYATATQIITQCSVKALSIGSEPSRLISPYQEPLIELSRCPAQRNHLNQQVIQNGDYPITRRLFVIVKQNGQEDERAGMAYAALLLSNQGQDLIDQTGFIRIR